MKIYSPIKSGGGSVLGKPESQLSQIISIHPDKAAESGEKLLIADGKTYNAGDEQMRELKYIYDSDYVNTETGDTSALTLNTLDISTTNNMVNMDGILVEDNLGDKYYITLKVDETVSRTNFDYTKLTVYKMASGQTTFTFFKDIVFSENWSSNNELGISNRSFNPNFFNFNPESGILYYIKLTSSAQVLRYNKINDVNDTNGFSSKPILKDDPFYNIDYYQHFSSYGVNTFHFNKKTKKLEGIVFERYKGSSNLRIVSIEIDTDSGQVTKLGTLKRYYNSTNDVENFSYLEKSIGRYFEDNSGKIFHTRISLNENSLTSHFIYKSFIGGDKTTDWYNYNYLYNHKYAKSTYFQTDDTKLHLIVNNLYSHPETGETLTERHFCIFEFDKHLNCKIKMFFPEEFFGTIFNNSTTTGINISANIFTSNEGISTWCPTEESAGGLGYANHITCFEFKDDTSLNDYRLIQILSNANETITDGTNTFNISQHRLALSHLTSEYYVIHYYAIGITSTVRDYAIVKIPSTFEGGQILASELEVIKVVNESPNDANKYFDNVPLMYYDSESLNTMFNASFQNFINNVTGVDNSIELVINIGVFGDKITVPDRTAYNDPNGLSKDYIIKSVKGIKGTTTGE